MASAGRRRSKGAQHAAGCTSLGKGPIAAASDLDLRRTAPRTVARGRSAFELLHRTTKTTPLPGSVTVAQQVLVLLVEVRILAG